jgi:hypothetical protein
MTRVCAEHPIAFAGTGWSVVYYDGCVPLPMGASPVEQRRPCLYMTAGHTGSDAPRRPGAVSEYSYQHRHTSGAPANRSHSIFVLLHRTDVLFLLLASFTACVRHARYSAVARGY